MRTRSSSEPRPGGAAGQAVRRSSAALLLDYDGTLVRIRRAPGEAALPSEVRDLLARLSRFFFVAVVSGRSLAETRRLVGLESLAYAGNHGLEMRVAGRTWIHPKARDLRPALRSALDAVRRRTRGVPGLLIEDKGLTASVHLRRVAAGRRAGVRAAVAEAASRRPGLRLARGKMVLELRPRIDWDKGRAVLKLLALARLPGGACPFYFGDDRTDEDAFRALAGKGLTVRVGRSAPTAAALRLPGTRAVRAVLGGFLELAEEASRPPRIPG